MSPKATVERMTSKAHDTRRRVLDAALELFREKGFDAASMRDIADAAGMAVGSAYYYFDSKEALVFAFYERSQAELDPQIREAIAARKEFKARVRAILEFRFKQFEPNRRFLGALTGRAADPNHPLSPFSEATRPIREAAIEHFRLAVEGSDLKVPKDLAPELPRLLWSYQMGLLLHWTYDRSPDQAKTWKLMDRSLDLLTGLLKLSSLPGMKPLRSRLLELVHVITGQDAA